MTSHAIAFKARWVLPVCGPPLNGGLVVVSRGRILAVGHDPLDAPVEDLGDVVLMPGLVNAHTHLEFSGLSAPLGARGMPLPDWIGEVMAYRRTNSDSGNPVAGGLQESIAGGVTSLGDIATADWRAGLLPSQFPQTVMFREAIGPTLSRARTAAFEAEAFLQAPGAAGITPALSPHAPYTVHARLIESLVSLSQKYRVPLAMHLAETREELELLNLGSGPFRELLESVGAWDSSEDARLSCTLDYLAELSRADRALVIHGNYLDDEEVAFLADHNERLAVVYCPRTHDYFEHEPYPLPQLLDRGVTMALGTDSRASNPDLSLLAEMQFLAQAHPEVSPASILELGTLGGARALGIANDLGTLEVGKRANLAAVKLEARGGCLSPTLEELLEEPAHVVATWIDGQKLVQDRIFKER